MPVETEEQKRKKLSKLADLKKNENNLIELESMESKLKL
jgi:hypothetical protein